MIEGQQRVEIDRCVSLSKMMVLKRLETHERATGKLDGEIEVDIGWFSAFGTHAQTPGGRDPDGDGMTRYLAMISMISAGNSSRVMALEASCAGRASLRDATVILRTTAIDIAASEV
jgi:hypothetical protein